MQTSHSLIVQHSRASMKRTRSLQPKKYKRANNKKAFAFFGLTETLLDGHRNSDKTFEAHHRHKRSKTVKTKEEVLPHSQLELDNHTNSLPNIDDQYKSDHYITFDLKTANALAIKIEDLDELESKRQSKNTSTQLHTPDT